MISGSGILVGKGSGCMRYQRDLGLIGDRMGLVDSEELLSGLTFKCLDRQAYKQEHAACSASQITAVYCACLAWASLGSSFRTITRRHSSPAQRI